jgi:hypothetical protein
MAWTPNITQIQRIESVRRKITKFIFSKKDDNQNNYDIRF